MKALKQEFGRMDGQPVMRYTLENDQQMRLSVLNYGGIVQEFSVLDGQDRINLVLSSADMTGFDNGYNINRAIGRTAGRIGNASWTQDGRTVTVPANEGSNNLHGGPDGLANQFFTVQLENDQIILTKTLHQAEDGFPGDLAVTIVYTLSEDNTVSITFKGQQDGTNGVFNPTQHLYFNLGSRDDIKEHQLWLNSQKRLAVGPDKVPTGELSTNAGSPYAVQPPVKLADLLTQLQAVSTEQGLDDAYLVSAMADEPVATLRDLPSGRQVDIYSQRNAIVAFTASQLTDQEVVGTNHGDGHPYIALALEAQNLPDSEHQPDFGDVTIQAGESQSYTIRYHYHKG